MLLWLHYQVASQLLLHHMHLAQQQPSAQLHLPDHRRYAPVQYCSLPGPCCLATLLWLPAGVHCWVARQQLLHHIHLAQQQPTAPSLLNPPDHRLCALVP
jgi:hypothetical protein